MTVQVITGDCRGWLRGLKANSFNACITSPPYYGLRNYQALGQIGLEATPDDYVAELVDVFREVRRVLRDDGTLWLNLGDSYVGSYGAQARGAPAGPSSTLRGNGHHGGGRKYEALRDLASRQTGAMPRRSITGAAGRMGLKNKDLIGIPWRVAFALQADGWWLRQDLIWHKLNPVPESVEDRCTKAHEYLFLLTKSGRYAYDHKAIAETSAYQPGEGWEDVEQGGFGGRGVEPTQGTSAFRAIRETRNKRSVWPISARPFTGEFCLACRTYFEGPELAGLRTGKDQREGRTVKIRFCRCGASDRWLGHHAPMPTEIVRPCILAGSPQGGEVLDPFGGAGTVGLVADELGRRATLIELNADYAEMSRQRINQGAKLFAPAAVSEP